MGAPGIPEGCVGCRYFGMLRIGDEIIGRDHDPTIEADYALICEAYPKRIPAAVEDGESCKRREAAERYENQRRPKKCPKCGEHRIAKILYGYIGMDDQLQKEIDADKVTIGGCCISDDDPTWQCVACYCEIYKKEKQKRREYE